MPQVAAHRPRATLGVLTDGAASFHPGTAEEVRAARGLIATHDTGVIADDDLTVWDVCFERRAEHVRGPTRESALLDRRPRMTRTLQSGRCRRERAASRPKPHAASSRRPSASRRWRYEQQFAAVHLAQCPSAVGLSGVTVRARDLHWRSRSCYRSAVGAGAVRSRDDLPPDPGVRVAEVDAASAILVVDLTRL
jgi:hypothetical protein